MSRARRFTAAVIAAILLACLSVTFVTFSTKSSRPVKAVEENAQMADKTMKVTFDIPKEAQVGGGLPTGTSINRGISFFNWIGANNASLTKGSRLVYETYSPTPVAGLGGFSGYEQNGTWGAWENFYDDTTVDQNGYSAKSNADLSEVIGNGWYSREIALPDSLTVKLPSGIGGNASSHWATHLDTPSPVPYEKLEVYFRNVRVVDEKGNILYYCFYNGDAEQAVSMYAMNAPQAGTRYCPPANDPSAEQVTVGSDTPWQIKTMVEYSEVAPIAIEQTAKTGAINTDIDLASMVNLQGATLKSITASDEDSNVVLVADNKMNVSAAGAYKIVYRAEKDGLSYTFVTVVYALDPTIPFIIPDDLKAIETLYDDKTVPVELPVIRVYYNGSETNATLTVKDKNGSEITVTQNGDNYTFVVEKCGIYSVVYSFKDGTAELVTDKIDVTVGVAKIDLENIDEGLVGTAYSLSKFVLDDPEAGAVALSKIEITAPDGRAIDLGTQKDSFMPTEAGAYPVVCEGIDYKGDTIKAEGTIVINGADDMVIKVSVPVAELARADGVKKYAVIRLFDDYRFNSMTTRDIFSYDIYMPNPLPGVGMLSMLEDGEGPSGSGAWNFFTAYDTEENGKGTDTDGIVVEGTNDLTSKLKNAEGKSVWHTRQFNLPKGWSGKDIRDFAFEINTTAACGETIDVYFKNIKFIRRDATETLVFTGSEHGVKSSVVWQSIDDKTDNWWATNQKTVVSVDEFPMINPARIPAGKKIAAGEKFLFPSDFLYDYQDKAAVSANITVTNDKGENVAISDGGFIPATVGEYEITATGKDKSNNTVTRKLTLAASDDSKPEIMDIDFGSLKTGDTVDLNALIKANDNIDGTNVKITVAVTAPDGSAVTLNDDNSFKISVAGKYSVKVTVRDSSNNQQERIFNFTAEKNNLGLILGLSLGIGIPVLVGIGIAAFIIIKKKKKTN